MTHDKISRAACVLALCASSATAAQDTTAQDTTAQDTTAQDTTAQDETAQDTTAQDTTAQDEAMAAQPPTVFPNVSYLRFGDESVCAVNSVNPVYNPGSTRFLLQDLYVAQYQQANPNIALNVQDDGTVWAYENGVQLPPGCLIQDGTNLNVFSSDGTLTWALNATDDGSWKMPTGCTVTMNPAPMVVTPAKIGIDVVPLDPALAKHLALEMGSSMVVAEVEEGGPAQLAGVEQYDVIVEIDDCSPATAELLKNKLAATSPGTVIRLQIQRGVQRIELSVTTVPAETIQWVWPQNPGAPMFDAGFPGGGIVYPQPGLWSPTTSIPQYDPSTIPLIVGNEVIQYDLFNPGVDPAATSAEAAPVEPLSVEERLTRMEAKLAEMVELLRKKQ